MDKRKIAISRAIQLCLSVDEDGINIIDIEVFDRELAVKGFKLVPIDEPEK